MDSALPPGCAMTTKAWGEIALIDLNNFYFAAEAAVSPHLQGLPVIILSNNDGTVISRSPAAKALGISMGEPAFKLKNLIWQEGIEVRSSNYELYGSMSRRFVQTVATLVPRLYQYSIDEVFCDLQGMPAPPLETAALLRSRVLKWTGMPSGVGVGPNATLAKLSNHIAKKFTDTGVFRIVSAFDHAELLSEIDVSEIWGIGNKIASKLSSLGVTSVADMLYVDRTLIREHFPITVQRTHAELQGHRLIHPWDDGTDKQAISCGRSFGRPVTTLHELTEAAAEFADRATNKLRAQGSVTSVIQVYARSNPFSAHATPYSRSKTIKLIRPTDDTREITRMVALALASIFNERVAFTKAGVVLLELEAKQGIQTDLFSAFSLNDKAEAVMSVYDAINRKFGRRSVCLGRATGENKWTAKAEHMSMRATSDWRSIPPCY